MGSCVCDEVYLTLVAFDINQLSSALPLSFYIHLHFSLFVYTHTHTYTAIGHLIFSQDDINNSTTVNSSKALTTQPPRFLLLVFSFTLCYTRSLFFILTSDFVFKWCSMSHFCVFILHIYPPIGLSDYPVIKSSNPSITSYTNLPIQT